MKEKNNKGFTLIEMLVVVLIIGILAGVALPQYTSAVRKARVAEAKIALRALIDATDRYILEHGDSYWDSLEDLDVQIPTDTKNWDFAIDECVGEALMGCWVVALPKWEDGWHIAYVSSSYDGGGWVGNGKFICYAATEEGSKICKSLGGTLMDGQEEIDGYYQL